MSQLENKKINEATPPGIEIKEAIMWTAKIKYRHVIAAGIILLSIAVTPFFMELAYLERGYVAYGGEYLIIPMGIALASIVISIAAAFDEARRKQGGINMQTVRAIFKD